MVLSSDARSPRTNIHLKGWHELKRITRKAHPNVFELVEIFKQEQSDTEVSIAQLDTGPQPPKRSVDKDKKIGELKIIYRFSQDQIKVC